jgi:uncharacterized phage protein (TIGR01671 family)
MNRVIKFRGWHKPTGRMIDLKKITPLALTADFPGDGLFIPFSEDVILMQFTGLKDVDGTDIYEGDVLKLIRNDKELPHFYKVHYDAPSFRINSIVPEGEEDLGLPLADSNIFYKSIKVIGNIYEQPHLIS